MRQLTNAGSFITGDAIAAAVMDYARALAAVGRVDVVSVPTIDGVGILGMTDILLVPSAGLMSSPYPTDEPEVQDNGIIADLIGRARNLAVSRFSGKPLAYDESEVWEHPGV